MDKRSIGFALLGVSAGMSILMLLGYTSADKKKPIMITSGIFLLVGIFLTLGVSLILPVGMKSTGTPADSKTVKDL